MSATHRIVSEKDFQMVVNAAMGHILYLEDPNGYPTEEAMAQGQAHAKEVREALSRIHGK